MEFALLDFGLPWDSLSFPSCFFLPFGMGMSILVLLVSQVHSWREILPQNVSLTFDLDEFLDFRVDAGIS